MRAETLAAAVVVSLASASLAPLSFAQPPATSGFQPNALMPVEPIRTTPQPRTQRHSKQQAGPTSSAEATTLRWRPSPHVTPAEKAMAAAPPQSSASVLADRRATPVAYLQDANATAPADAFGSSAGHGFSEGDGALPPRAGRKPAADPFLDPFNDGQAAGITTPSDERSLRPAGRENPGLRRLQPVAQQQPQEAAEAEPFNLPLNPDVQEAPPETSETEPTDTNPFPRRADDEPSASDRERSDGGSRVEQKSGENLRDRSERAPRYDRDPGQREEPSCDDLRERIAARTIRKVSLDISPPFRPDVLAEDEYEMLREQFVENQATRQWRSISGETIGSGRLVDMAFENVIIQSDDGQEMELSWAELSEPDLAYVTEAWGLPRECQLPQIAFQPREWLPIRMTWKASELCHKPLYFEEVNLERYGHTAGPFAQPVVSTAHFFFNIAVLPYKMGIHPPHECQYALGYYRPGNCAPWIIPPVPLSLRGALAETAVVGGMIGLIP